MDPEEKGIAVKILELATGITAVTAVVVVSSVIGLNAYVAFQPAALEAQAINIAAQNAPVTSTTESAACQQEIAAAAARGTPDAESVITDQSSLQFEDQCVAAVLNPAVTGLGPNNPGSYMCVGKSAKVNVNAAGLITETAVPDPAVPAGTCSAVACSSDGADGQSNCFAADNLTSLTGSSVEQNLAAAQASEISPDSGITSYTLNADGSIADESANTTDVLSSSAGDENLAGNSVSLDQSAADQGIGAQSTNVSQGVPSLGETQAVSGEPTQLPEIEVTPPETSAADTADTAESAGTADVDTAAVAPDTSAETAPVETDTGVSAPAQSAASIDDTASPQLSEQAALNGPQPTTPTITDSGSQTGGVSNVPSEGAASAESSASSQNIFERALSEVVNDVRGFFGLSSDDQDVVPTNDNLGIRG